MWCHVVPDRGGFPPSTAVSVSSIATNSAETLCSPPLCKSKEKCIGLFSMASS
uniref:Uncharacterized protein n=2 Tax=Astyanax mexicanus TaxID=7994 RepID=A0A8B9GRG5_ASTMX